MITLKTQRIVVNANKMHVTTQLNIFSVIQNICYARLRQVESRSRKKVRLEKVVHGQYSKKKLANVLHFRRVVSSPGRAHAHSHSLFSFPLE